MAASCGSDRFNERFDSFLWKAPYIETPDEVIKSIETIGLKGRTLKGINIIGSVEAAYSNKAQLAHTIRAAGISYEQDLWNTWVDRYPYLDKVQVPQKVRACEPIQFVFDNDVTLEFMPLKGGGARVGINSIPVGLTDGLNMSDFDANVLYSELIGTTISDVVFTVEKSTEIRMDRRNEKDKIYGIRLSFTDCNDLEIKWNREIWYSVEQKCFESDCQIPFSQAKMALNGKKQVIIIPGRDRGGVFWISDLSRTRYSNSE